MFGRYYNRVANIIKLHERGVHMHIFNSSWHLGTSAKKWLWGFQRFLDTPLHDKANIHTILLFSRVLEKPTVILDSKQSKRLFIRPEVSLARFARTYLDSVAYYTKSRVAKHKYWLITQSALFFKRGCMFWCCVNLLSGWSKICAEKFN